MEIVFNNCNRIKIISLIIIGFLLVLVLLSTKLSVQIISGVCLLVYLLTMINLRKSVAKIILQDNIIEVITCSRLGIRRNISMHSYSNISYNYSKEIYPQGVRNILILYEVNTNGLICKITDNGGYEEEVNNILDRLVEMNCKKI